MSDADRLERLETRLAFHERSLQELGDVVYRQERVIERLEAGIKMLTERIAELAEALPETSPDDPRPPHY